VGIGKDQIDVAVVVDVEAVNPLDDAGGIHVEIVTPIVAAAAGKLLESTLYPGASFIVDNRFPHGLVG